MIVNMKDILQNALLGHYAVPALNTQGGNADMIRAICLAAQKIKSPVILAHYDGCSGYAGLDYAIEYARFIAAKVDVPVAVHLDHGSSFELCRKAIDLGCTSVMFDGSLKPVKDNIAETKEVIEYARTRNVTVEAEIGAMAAKGCDSADNVAKNCADIEEIKEFISGVRPDALAIAIGNAHGFYTATPKLNFELLRQARELTDIPFVLHGGTGIPVADVQKAIKMGICKVNIGTEIRCNYVKYLSDGIVKYGLTGHAWQMEKDATDRMIEDVENTVLMCGSKEKA